MLDAEADWLDSRQELAGALSSYHKALLEIELADGALLQDNHQEITPRQLRQQTEAMLGANRDYLIKHIPPPPDEFSPVPASSKSTPN